MTEFEYKVVPAPRRPKKVKGIRGTPDLFALTLADAVNEQARQGWEFLRAEQLLVEERRGWFRGTAETYQAVLVFRRAREAGPRLAAVGAGADEREAPSEPLQERSEGRAAAELLGRVPVRRGGMAPREERQEPRIGAPGESPAGATPLRPVPKLGPAEKG